MEVKNKKRKNGKLSEVWRRFKKNKTAMIGLFIFIFFMLILIFGNVIAPIENVSNQAYEDALQGPSSEHIFGTDEYGRDIFARVIHGTKYSLGIAFAVTIVSTIFGIVIGTVATYKGGFVDGLLMRLMDVLTSIPALLLSMCVVAALGTSVWSLFLALTISGTPGAARIVRTSLLNVVGNEYVEACRACGTGTVRLLARHVIPNALGPIIVNATMTVATNILACATLSFIGLGFQEPTPEWGAMLSLARERFRTHMYMMVFPGIGIILSSLSINLMGDGLRDALDPKLRN